MKTPTSQCLVSKKTSKPGHIPGVTKSDYGNSTFNNKFSVPGIDSWCIFGVVFNRADDCARYDEHNQLGSW